MTTTSADIQIVCDSLIWIDGNTYTSNNNSATHTLTNAAGCDSIVTLDLTINTLDNSIFTNADSIMANVAGAAYQWLDCANSNAIIPGEIAATITPEKKSELNEVLWNTISSVM